ncbi:MAG: arylsulfatase [Pseudomonadota bacterium]
MYKNTTFAPLLLAALLGAALPAPLRAASPAPRPNIVVLVADDWGFSDVGAYGSEIATPHIDSLAARGMRFSNFHVAASCSPTRAMLLTGVDNHRNGVGNMPETMPPEHLGKPGYDGVLNDRVVTVASMLRDHGYHTYATGKWHLGKTAATLPDRRGFERSFIQADSGSDNWEQKPYIFLYDKATWLEQGQPAQLPKDYYSSTFIVDKALDYIAGGRQDGKPFFAYLGFQANHIPLQAPQAYLDKYKGRYQAGWSALRQARRQRAAELGLVPAQAGMVTMASSADWNALDKKQQAYEARRMEVYGAMAEAMDAEVGRLIAHLKREGQYDNTVFVFLSDNGAEATDPNASLAIRAWLAMNYSQAFERLGGKGAFASIGPSWASAAAAPLSGYKFFAGEGGLRTPLIVAGVPGMQRNAIAPAFAHVTDIMPTLLDVAGVAPHAGSYRGQAVEPLAGTSLLPLLQGQVQRVHPASQPVGYELSGNAALFKGDYKLTRNLAPAGDGLWHLYDIATDPGEVNDLQASQPAAFRQMQADYAAYAQAHGVLPMPAGYDYLVQGQLYALHHVLLPKLKAALPALLASGALLLGGGWWLWRRRRPARAGALAALR